MMNAGYIEASNDGVMVRIYYDATAPVGKLQPLINGPRGWCLDMTNTAGRLIQVVFTLPNGTKLAVNVGQGDPVIGGPPAGRSRTAAQMVTLGFTTRGDVAGLSI